MNLKLITNNIKEAIEELSSSHDRARAIVRSNRYHANIGVVELRAVLCSKDVNLVIDVGANDGQFYRQLRNSVGYKGMVFSFEPNPEVVNILEQQKSADQAWHVFPFALGAKESVLTFNIYDDSKLSSFLEGSGNDSERFRNKFSKVKTVNVPVRTLDNVLDQSKDLCENSSIFLKLDTQGFDIEVFKGVQEHKQSIKFIQNELSVIPLYKNMPHYTESISFFESQGYKLMSLIPVTREKNTGHVIEFDALWGSQRS